MVFTGGGDLHADIDMTAGDADLTGGDAGHPDADASFKLLSFQGLTAFFMMFGLVGLALLNQSKVGEGLAILGALIAGMITVWVVSKIFSVARRFQSSGTIDNTKAIGEEGTVYLNIPAEGTGKVQVVVQNHLRIFDAVSDLKEEIKTGERVMVTRVVSGNVMVVQKI
jgi:membrane-bound ClpP family serine protease